MTTREIAEMEREDMRQRLENTSTMTHADRAQLRELVEAGVRGEVPR